MKTDVITITNDGGQMDNALMQAEKMAVYKELSPKSALHLRLLTEEMLGMMRAITGPAEGSFWIEDVDDSFQLHLKMETHADHAQREKLLSASTSGKNEAARGIMGRIRTFFDPLDDYYMVPMVPDMIPDGVSTDLFWSMRAYQEMVQAQLEQQQEGAAEAWDELEKSVVSHVADDVKVSIRDRDVEMVIFKKMR